MSGDTDSTELDRLWYVVEDFVKASLEGKEPTKESLMRAYSAEMQLETTRGVLNTRADGTQAHGVRRRIVRLVRAYAGDHSGESLEQFKENWEKATRFIFKYHERHYVQRCRDEERTHPPGTVHPVLNELIDDGITSIYELGLETWKRHRQELRSNGSPTSCS